MAIDTIGTNAIANDAVTAAKIPAGAVDADITAIPDGSVTNAKVASGISASKLTGPLPAISGANLTGISPPTYVGEMLITGGGGSGGSGLAGSYYGGAGGAGSCLHLMDMIFTTGEAVTVSAIGAGGTTNFSNSNQVGQAGGSTTVSVGNSGKTYTLAGGGRGAASGVGATAPGGGGSLNATSGGAAASAFSDPSINRIVGPFAGSNYVTGGMSGGGGGAIGAGDGSGNGGAGYTSTISGSSVQYSQGGHKPSVAANTGYGSGGNGGRSTNLGSNGVQGVVIIRIPTASYSGTTSGSPTVTTSGNFTIITFTSTGSYTA